MDEDRQQWEAIAASHRGCNSIRVEYLQRLSIYLEACILHIAWQQKTKTNKHPPPRQNKTTNPSVASLIPLVQVIPSEGLSVLMSSFPLLSSPDRVPRTSAHFQIISLTDTHFSMSLQTVEMQTANKKPQCHLQKPNFVCCLSMSMLTGSSCDFETQK